MYLRERKRPAHSIPPRRTEGKGSRVNGGHPRTRVDNIPTPPSTSRDTPRLSRARRSRRATTTISRNTLVCVCPSPRAPTAVFKRSSLGGACSIIGSVYALPCRPRRYRTFYTHTHRC